MSDDRVTVNVWGLEGEVIVTGKLCGDTMGSDWFEITHGGIRSSYPWDRVERIEVVRPR